MNLGLDWQALSLQLVITFAHFLWQGALVAVAFSVALRLFSRSHASVHYLLASAAFGLLPICVLATFLLVNHGGESILASKQDVAVTSASLMETQPLVPSQDATEQSLVAETALPDFNAISEADGQLAAWPDTRSPSVQQADWRDMLSALSPYLFGCYVVGVSFMLARVSMSMCVSARLRSAIQPIADMGLLQIIREQASRLGLKRIPLVALCNRVSVPMVVGVLKPTIFLPATLLCGLDPNQLGAILSHEMAHIRRYDLLVNLLQRLIESLLFFHPVTWWISHRMSVERENCCDDLAASGCGEVEYAGALLRMAEKCAIARRLDVASRLGSLAADGHRPSQLSYRIHRLLGERETPRVSLTRGALAIIAVALLLGSASVIAFAQNGKDSREQPRNQANKSKETPPAKQELEPEPDNDGIYWSDRDKDGLVAGMRVVERPTAESPTLVVRHVLRNASDRERTLDLSIHGRARPTVDVSAHNRIRADFSGGSWMEEPTVAAAQVLQPEHWQTVFNLEGLEPGEYSVRLGSVFFVPVEGEIGTRTSIPFDLTLRITIPKSATAAAAPSNSAAMPESDSPYATLPIRWGEPVSGLRIGMMFVDTPKTGAQRFHHGDLAQAQLFVRNVAKKAVECRVMLPHPMDGWGLNINDAGGSSVKRNQVFISMFSPMRLLSARLASGEIQPITGKLSKFREGNEDDGYVPDMKHVEFRIAEEAPQEAEHTPPFTYGTPNGRYIARCYANLRRTDIPDVNISVETGSIQFQVGDAITHQPRELNFVLSPVQEEESTGATDSPEEVQEKYPHCLVEVENLGPRSLGVAINAFNSQSMESPIGRLQPPVTEAETLEAIKAFSQQPHLPASAKAALRELAATKELPSTAYFRRFTRFDDGQSMRRVWWVRLVITSDDPPVYSVPIRTKELSSRSYTQMERQQNAEGGVTLINRFSSYFEVPPNILLLAEFPQAAKDRLIADAKAAIAGDAGAFERLFSWEGVSDSTRQFVTAELEQLRKANIESIEIRARNFKAKLVHWSAYQRYQPNLPIVGYLDIKYRPGGPGQQPAKVLSLEMGKTGDDLRLVNYIKEGESELPKKLVKGLSISGQMEPLADGTFLMTTITTNPGSLLSAHLANEEVWQRDLHNRE